MSDDPVGASDQSDQRCGKVALIGRPNVGKSTLLNRLVGQKLSITAHRPQTTRHRILGVATAGPVQVLYIDTPGLHQHAGTALNRRLNKSAGSALEEADLVLLVSEACAWEADDDLVLERLRRVDKPWLLVANKVDRIKRKADLLPCLQRLAAVLGEVEIFPLSARTGDNLARLREAITARMPRGPHVFPPDQLTDCSERFLAAELIREQLTRQLGQELPYAVSVEVERFDQDGDLARIAAVVWVDRESQKGIVIGKSGARLREIGQRARLAMAAMFGGRVHLQLWVKVKRGWADDERALRQLGYGAD